jgi:hypothetical protein
MVVFEIVGYSAVSVHMHFWLSLVYLLSSFSTYSCAYFASIYCAWCDGLGAGTWTEMLADEVVTMYEAELKVKVHVNLAA